MTVNDQTRNKVWQDLLDMSRVSRYFDALYRRYRRRDLATRLVLAAAGLGLLSPLVEVIPEGYRTLVLSLCASAVVAVAISDLVFDPAGKKTILRGVDLAVKTHEQELRRLWERVEAGVEVEDERVLDQSSEILRQAQKSAEAISLHTNPRLNRRCAKDAYKVEMDRYGAAYAATTADAGR